MTIKIGDKLPTAAIKAMTEGGLVDVATDDLFLGHRVAVFALPGAFTPTCSARHLPSFLEHHDALHAKGIQAIVCMSVNDPYVMCAWGREQHIQGKIMMLADGNADFTRAMGLEWDHRNSGMGTRCRRFSMIVNDGIVEALYVEEPGKYAVSSAEHMLANL